MITLSSVCLTILCLFLYEIKTVEKYSCAQFIHLLMRAIKTIYSDFIQLQIQTESFQLYKL